jgi:hypothetical protein
MEDSIQKIYKSNVMDGKFLKEKEYQQRWSEDIAKRLIKIIQKTKLQFVPMQIIYMICTLIRGVLL